MSEIPEEVIKEIIFRLPVKSLLKFRCVSHSWHSLIDSPYFVKTQLSYSTPKIIINNLSSLYVLDINTLNSTVLELSYPPKTSKLQTIIKGSCNGILLSYHSERDFALQNPCTKILHKIPYVDFEWPGSESQYGVLEIMVYGLGYDKLTDDYKVVRNVQFLTDLEKAFYSSVNVYSLRTKSWKKVDPFPYYVLPSEGVFTCGALHWVVITSARDLSQGIMAFDLSTDEYRLVQPPVCSIGEFLVNVNVLGGCLVATYNYSSMGYMDLWAMKEYGEAESWSKAFTVRGSDIGFDFRGYVKPLIYSECRKKVLMEKDGRTLLWYDLENKSAEYVQVGGCQLPERFKTIVLSESLVQLSYRGIGDVERGAQKDDEKSNNRPTKRDRFLSTGFKLKL